MSLSESAAFIAAASTTADSQQQSGIVASSPASSGSQLAEAVPTSNNSNNNNTSAAAEDDDEADEIKQREQIQQQQNIEEDQFEIEELYNYKLEQGSASEWFNTLEKGILLSQEKSQDLHIVEASTHGSESSNNSNNNNSNKQQQDNSGFLSTTPTATILEPFAQQCMHLFSGEWTTLKSNTTYEKNIPDESQYVRFYGFYIDVQFCLVKKL